MRRFNRATNKRDVIERLLASNGGAFVQIWQIIIFAACLGFKHGRREPLGEVDSSVAIPPSVFANNCSSWPGIVYLVSIVDSSDANVLNSDETTDENRMKILEEYANGGLEMMRESLEPRDYSLDSICQILANDISSGQITRESI